MIKIDKNIPIPSREIKYPFQDMEVGDSFAIDCEDIKKVRIMQASLIANINRSKYLKEKKFTTRTDGTKMEVRIWRIK